MVDKDLNEIHVLKPIFPDTRVLLCHFHVIKWLRGAVRNDNKYGTYRSDELEQLDFCVGNMVYSKSEEEFQQHADEFKVVACRDQRDALWKYFETNWIACKEMWVTLYRMNLPHFRNNTNNRLQIFSGKLKTDLDSSMSMKLCLEAVIRYQRRNEDGYVVRVVMPGSKRNHNFNDGMNQLLGMSSDWLVDVFSSEYKFASAPGAMDSCVVEDDELFVTLRRDRRVHKVDKFNWLCSCEFSSTMLLPCRHSMLYRKLVCGLFMILFASISAK
ncbi:hypothetical protein PI124_g22376 [Phytophthora idaei]|nr:hypothetical protein PI125_g23994 [Phytophthora idaei]KAG3126708.1 hypothetical protein PI126_g22208 [Phytophthora idaei]KAG3232542.1 hypothetical protein PI124_g22376 [Phytophthora idaei]